jgi:hypothetical protein
MTMLVKPIGFGIVLGACLIASIVTCVSEEGHTPDNACSSLAKEGWGDTERLAWKQICTGSVDVNATSDSSNKRLGSEFLEAIFTDPVYTTHIRGRRLKILGFALASVDLTGVDLDQIEFVNCTLETLSLIRPNVRGVVLFENVVFSQIRIDEGKLGSIRMRRTMGMELILDSVTADNYSLFDGSTLQSLTIQYSHFHSDLTFEGNEIWIVTIYDSKVDGSIAWNYTKGELQIRDIKVGGNIDFSSTSTISKIEIENATATTILLPYSVKGMQVSHSTFSEWPNALNTTIDLLTNNTIFDPKMFDQIARAYRNYGEYGGADQIRYLKRNLDFAHSEGFARFFLFLSWITVGYGLRPTFGLVWFGGLIVIGYFVFRTGEHALASEHKPRSWFVFSLDTILPVIKLDPEHDKIAFKGWRQYYLYGMKVLSAILIFLIAKILGDIIASY